jgi:hypothetical protein
MFCPFQVKYDPAAKATPAAAAPFMNVRREMVVDIVQALLLRKNHATQNNNTK